MLYSSQLEMWTAAERDNVVVPFHIILIMTSLWHVNLC